LRLIWIRDFLPFSHELEGSELRPPGLRHFTNEEKIFGSVAQDIPTVCREAVSERLELRA
jgi:hypothetical protein